MRLVRLGSSANIVRHRRVLRVNRHVTIIAGVGWPPSNVRMCRLVRLVRTSGRVIEPNSSNNSETARNQRGGIIPTVQTVRTILERPWVC